MCVRQCTMEHMTSAHREPLGPSSLRSRGRSRRAVIVAVSVLALLGAAVVGCGHDKASARTGDGGTDGGGGSGDAGNMNNGAPSLEVARVGYGNDYTYRDDAPQGGTLFSVWTKIPDPCSSYPGSRGNMDVYVLRSSAWYIRFIVGNSSASSPTDARYNANSMLFATPGDTWVNDYSYYESGGGHAEAPYRDWVWAAWQVVVGSSSFTIRQWLKFGSSGAVFAAGENTVTFADVRSILQSKGWSSSAAAAWSPTDATSFQVGYEHGYLTRAQMVQRSSKPSLSELEAIATRTSPDTSAWADYAFVWANGAPDLHDQSGHGRDLLLKSGGTLYQVPAGPSF